MSAASRDTPARIADRLRTEIVAGTIVSGAELNQVHLARRFGVSRIPVREALRRLEAEGFLLYRPNRGAIVTELSAASIAESLEIRGYLEVAVMRHALPNLTARTLTNATAILDEMHATKTIDRLRGMHLRFHALLYAHANRPQMARIIAENRWRFSATREHEERGLVAFVEAADPIHRALLTACRRRDAVMVTRCVRDELTLLTNRVTGDS